MCGSNAKSASVEKGVVSQSWGMLSVKNFATVHIDLKHGFHTSIIDSL